MYIKELKFNKPSYTAASLTCWTIVPVFLAIWVRGHLCRPLYARIPIIWQSYANWMFDSSSTIQSDSSVSGTWGLTSTESIWSLKVTWWNSAFVFNLWLWNMKSLLLTFDLQYVFRFSAQNYRLSTDRLFRLVVKDGRKLGGCSEFKSRLHSMTSAMDLHVFEIEMLCDCQL